MKLKQSFVLVVLGLAAAAGVSTPTAGPSEIVARQDPPRPPQQQSELVLALDNPSYQPRVGIPDFIAGGDAELQAAAKMLADVLAADLDFEREFIVVDRKLASAVPVAATPEAINFDQWRQLGADFVVYATMKRAGADFAVDLKLLLARGTPPGQQRFGSEYSKCAMSNPRYCAHFIADDMHMKIRNVLGVARTKIAFASDRDASRIGGRPDSNTVMGKEIYVSDYDGANQRAATANRSLNINPTWLPDARGLAYTSYVSQFPDVYVSLFDGRPPSRPAGGNAQIQNTLPAMSPDGRRIAFMSGRGGRQDVWIVDRDGNNLRNLTPNTPNSDEGAPTWSPAGNQIAFTSDRTGTNQIYVVNVDGLGRAERLPSDMHSDAPTWSSLNFIAFTLGSGPGHDVAVVDLSKREVRVLTDGLGSNKQPTVSPNGRHIAFVTTRWGREQIAILDYPTGSKTYRRVTDSGNNTFPDWSPVPGGK